MRQKHNRTTTGQYRGLCDYRRYKENTVETLQDEEVANAGQQETRTTRRRTDAALQTRREGR
eukprot:14509339-Heterocapsa_arctica.AAC.1